MPANKAAAPLQVALALLAVYIIWGSTYLAIRFAVATLPPFLMAGVRFLMAGALLYLFTRQRGIAAPSWANWRAALIVGGLLLVCGNGFVSWAEGQGVPSGFAALLISTTPIWMALIDWLRPGGQRPTLAVTAGLLLGFAGVALLVAPTLFAGGHATSLIAIVIIPLGSFAWAAGSIYSRTAAMPASPLMGTSLEMLAGGGLLLIIGLVTGESSQLHLEKISLGSSLALAYLIVFGSLVAFTAYVWLLQNTTLARASTYAYVNPVVAVFLGWALAGERLTPTTVIAAAVIVAAVIVITTFRATTAPVPQVEVVLAQDDIVDVPASDHATDNPVTTSRYGDNTPASKSGH